MPVSHALALKIRMRYRAPAYLYRQEHDNDGYSARQIPSARGAVMGRWCASSVGACRAPATTQS